jgi:iron complex transport system ATP-binding protein
MSAAGVMSGSNSASGAEANMGGEAVLLARGLTWTVGEARILDGVDLSVARGELVGVIGPNGAGKTTLLRLLGGLLAPSSGRVLLKGRSVSEMDDRARARWVSFMSQDVSQVYPFTVMEILLMGRYPHLGRFQKETAGDRERARRMLSYVGLGPLEDRTFSGLSGGERQLVLFAKTLVQETDALLLDEPSSSLDIHHEDRIFSMAQELAREGRAVVASVHNLTVAAQYCSRLVMLEKGRVAADGRPPEVLRSELLDRVYGARTMVSPSLATGSLTVMVLPGGSVRRGTRVHLIGGAGSAVNLTRELYRMGCELTGGIAHEHDSDERLWKSLDIPRRSVGAFSRITDDEVSQAAAFVEEADLTILCCFPVGSGNLGNLRLAIRARRLVVLKPGPEDVPRSFFSEEGRELFDRLLARASLLPHDEILQEIEVAGPRGS